MPAITVAQVESDVLSIFAGVLKANEAAIVPVINAGEAQIVTGLAKIFALIPHPSGIFGSLEGDIETGFENNLEALVTKYIQQYGGQAVLDLVIALLTKAAAAV